jgi:hypothetical protein
MYLPNMQHLEDHPINVLVAYFLSTSFFAVGFFDFDLAKKKKRDATGLYLLA